MSRKNANRRPTIHDVAARASVSAATASKVVRGVAGGHDLARRAQLRVDLVVPVQRDLAAQEVILDGSAIKRLEPLPNSLMPAGLLGAMSDQEIADLVAYLASRKEG